MAADRPRVQAGVRDGVEGGNASRFRAGFAVVPVLGVIAFALLPSGSAAQAAAHAGAGLTALFALCVGGGLNRPENRRGWNLLAGGLAFWVVADAFQWGEHRGAPAAVAEVLYVSGSLALLTGVLTVTSRGRTGAIGAFLDTAVIGVCGGILAWVLGVGREAGDHGAAAHIVASIPAVVDIALVAGIAQLLVVRSARRLPVVHLLLGAAIAILAFDEQHRAAGLGHHRAVEAGWLLAYVLLAGAALHPSAGALRPELGPLVATGTRVALLAAACFTLPVVFVIEASRGPVDAEIFGGWGAVLVVLVFARMNLFFRQQRANERGLRAVFEQSLDAMLVTDDAGRYIDVNPAACALIGRSRDEILALSVEDVVGESTGGGRAASLQEFRQAGQRRGEVRIVRPDGSRRIADYASTPDYLPGRHLSVLRDVTERRRLEQELRASQKLEAVGRLAGGVAHDFNNLLTAIGGYGRLILDGAGDEAERTKLRVEQIVSASDRASDLTRQLLAFSRRQVLQPRVFDLNEAISEAQTLLRRLLGDNVRIVASLAPGGCPVRADRDRIEEILANLGVNARDAMPDGGTLAIETETDGDSVLLYVTDTGVGMDSATLEHAFEPFFTTKGTGKGTGLGLATVHGTVIQSGGEIRVRSRPGAGATFEIRLPRSPLEPEACDDPAEPPATGSERILLVEDEAVVRELTCEMLEREGYCVLCAADPEEALDLAEREAIDALVTDVVMPKMSGRDLAIRLRRSRPDLPIVYTSGYSGAAFEDGELEEGAAFVRKPFAARDLGRAVRGVLAEAGTRAPS